MSLIQQLKPEVSAETYKKFTKLIIPGGSRDYFLLDLNNGQYAAFWRPTIVPDSIEEMISRLDAGILISNEDRKLPFITGLAYITDEKSKAIAYIKEMRKADT